MRYPDDFIQNDFIQTMCEECSLMMPYISDQSVAPILAEEPYNICKLILVGTDVPNNCPQ